MVIILKTVITYFLLIFLIRVMGKRQLGELEVSELIVAFMLSELASAPLIEGDKSLLDGFIPIIALVSLEMLVAYLTMKLPSLKRIIYGSPSVIVYKGKLDKRELKRQRLELGELLTSARESGIVDFSEVRYCILEGDGKLSFFREEDGEISLPIILDRRVISKNLRFLGFDRGWLKKRLSDKGLSEKDIFLMCATEGGDIYIIERK